MKVSGIVFLAFLALVCGVVEAWKGDDIQKSSLEAPNGLCSRTIMRNGVWMEYDVSELVATNFSYPTASGVAFFTICRNRDVIHCKNSALCEPLGFPNGGSVTFGSYTPGFLPKYYPDGIEFTVLYGDVAANGQSWATIKVICDPNAIKPTAFTYGPSGPASNLLNNNHRNITLRHKSGCVASPN